MDVFLLEMVVAELREKAAGSRIDRIHQPEAELLTLRLWNGRERLLLLLEAVPGRSRIHLGAGAGSNPAAPHRFCQLLRARARRIEAIEQQPGERVVRIELSGPDRRRSRLMVELTGRTAELVLVDDRGRIVDTLRRREAGPGRSLAPGEFYQDPFAAGLRPLADPLPAIPDPDAFRRQPGRFRDWLLATFRPFSPAVARVLARRVAEGEEPRAALGSFRKAWLEGALKPAVVRLGAREVPMALPEPFLADLDHRSGPSSPSALLDDFFGRGRDSGGEKLLRERLETLIGRHRRRLERRLERIAADGERLQRWLDFQRWGELLLAHPASQEAGRLSLEVTDWYADPPEPVVIPLDPALGPRQNAARYLHRAARGKRGREHVGERRRATLEELEWLESVDVGLRASRTMSELREVEVELVEAGLVRTARPRPASAPAKVPGGIGRAVTPGGFELLWGKNNRANDHLLRHASAPEDLWFHAFRIPGCHLLLRTAGKGEVPEADQEFAAALAAGCSRAAGDTAVEVMVASRRRVRKVKGMLPGQVRVDEFRTLRVAPRRPD